jgi:V/A-type H+-transporting ATPase subunit I
VLVVFIETLETIIGYVSNTLSFLRVAAFSLNHAALSIAVLTLAGMMGAAGTSSPSSSATSSCWCWRAASS